MNKIFFLATAMAIAVTTAPAAAFTHQDTLRGSDGSGRRWWNLLHYDLNIHFDTLRKAISGSNTITLEVAAIPADTMQLDLQEPMVVDSVVFGNRSLPIAKEGNVWWVRARFSELPVHSKQTVTVFFHGKPSNAKNPPWDGGFSWARDDNNKLWAAVSCQGLGASVWFPCKDVQWDEPDSGVNLSYTVPKGLVCVANGRLTAVGNPNPLENEWHWQVKNPINNYDITFYIGDYVHWSDTVHGEKGRLDLDFWVLRNNEEKARRQFDMVKNMMHCFEYWMGPYPFYEDGYKLVEAPYLGMEHQSAVAYGNKYKMGYMGHDRGASGIGMDFDYIIVHESGHEWFGNNVTAKDQADNWIHEGITTFSECLYVQCLSGAAKAKQYALAGWKNIINNKTVIGNYGVNEDGGNDMYDKGAALMQMIRELTGNDEVFRKMMRGITEHFYHTTVTSATIENYVSTATGRDFSALFHQYLRTTDIPELEYYIKDNQLFYKFNHTVAGFSLPLKAVNPQKSLAINPTADWQHVKWKYGFDVSFTGDFLFTVKQ
jgi:aminopeptidase N